MKTLLKAKLSGKEPVNRVVLDTNYYRGANVLLLRELARKGFSISLSVNAFVEHWARTYAKDNLGLLVGRTKNVAEFIDKQLPLLPTGLQLVAFVGGTNRDGLDPQLNRFMQWTSHVWQELTSGNVPKEWWKQGADAGTTTMNDHGKTWTSLRDMSNFIFPEHLALPAELAFRRIASEFLQAAAFLETMPGNVQSRKHAFYVVSALHIVRSHQQPNSYSRDENTAEDIDLLQHLATPAILLTRDFELIQFVDESRTHQGPWVRTIGELLTDGPPVGLPWGRNAHRCSEHFQRRPRKELAALDDQVLQSLRASAPSNAPSNRPRRKSPCPTPRNHSSHSKN